MMQEVGRGEERRKLRDRGGQESLELKRPAQYPPLPPLLLSHTALRPPSSSCPWFLFSTNSGSRSAHIKPGLLPGGAAGVQCSTCPPKHRPCCCCCCCHCCCSPCQPQAQTLYSASPSMRNLRASARTSLGEGSAWKTAVSMLAMPSRSLAAISVWRAGSHSGHRGPHGPPAQ